MEDILYKNSPSDIRIREMVSITANQNKHDYSKDYLTFEALEDGTFTLTISKDNYGGTLDITSISYSIDNGNNWVTTQRSANATTTITTPTITQGDKVLWKGIATSFYNGNGPGITSIFSSTGKFNVYGNIMSLLYDDDFEDKIVIPGTEGNFGRIFENAVNLINVENLILPATTLTSNCYYRMFSGCASLTKAPELPAITLANDCYNQMFYCCTALTTAPELPAITLAQSCYQEMFLGCTSLTVIPNILPATTLARNCYNGMFNGCTLLTTAPELPATTLIFSCYYQMFKDCSNLNYIKAMFTTEPSTSYTDHWVNSVKSTGTFVKNSAANWNVTGDNGVPTGWTVKTASA